jgi:hypothetical protein
MWAAAARAGTGRMWDGKSGNGCGYGRMCVWEGVGHTVVRRKDIIVCVCVDKGRLRKFGGV